VCGIALSAGGAYAYYFDSARANVIAIGVQIDGVDVGGLHAGAARQLLETRLAERLRGSVSLVYGSQRFGVSPRRAGLHVEIAATVAAAVEASRSGSLAHRFFRDVGGQPLQETIPLQAEVSRRHIETLIDHVAQVVDRPARNARVLPKPLATGLRIIPSVPGLAVKRPLLERALTSALLAFDGPRTLTVPTRSVAPHVWTSTLTRHYGTYILVSRETFTLRLYKSLKLTKTYRIAVGQAGPRDAGGRVHDQRQAGEPLLARAAEPVGRRSRRPHHPARPR
jgi:Putative peptidoglycan binding domain